MRISTKIVIIVVVSALLFTCAAIGGAWTYSHYNNFNRLNADAVVGKFVDAVLKMDYNGARECIGMTKGYRKHLEEDGRCCDVELDRRFPEWWADTQGKIKRSRKEAKIERIYFKSLQHKGEDIIVWYHVETSIFYRTQIGIGVNLEGSQFENKVVRLGPLHLAEADE